MTTTVIEREHRACPRCLRTAMDIGGDGPGCGDYLNCPGTMVGYVPVEAGEALAQALERHPFVDASAGPSGAALARWRALRSSGGSKSRV